MDKEKIDELWSLVERVGKAGNLNHEAMVTLGNVYGQMEGEILKQQNENRELNGFIKQLQREIEGLGSIVNKCNCVEWR